MLFRFLIDGKEYTARMHDIPIVHEIAAICPIDQIWQRSDNHEYYTRLKQPLQVNGKKETSEIKKNRLYLFAAWNAFSINYRDMSIAPFKVIELGEFTEDISPVLDGAPSQMRARCEVEKE